MEGDLTFKGNVCKKHQNGTSDILRRIFGNLEKTVHDEQNVDILKVVNDAGKDGETRHEDWG